MTSRTWDSRSEKGKIRGWKCIMMKETHNVSEKPQGSTYTRAYPWGSKQRRVGTRSKSAWFVRHCKGTGLSCPSLEKLAVYKRGRGVDGRQKKWRPPWYVGSNLNSQKQVELPVPGNWSSICHRSITQSQECWSVLFFGSSICYTVLDRSPW